MRSARFTIGSLLLASVLPAYALAVPVEYDPLLCEVKAFYEDKVGQQVGGAAPCLDPKHPDPEHAVDDCQEKAESQMARPWGLPAVQTAWSALDPVLP